MAEDETANDAVERTIARGDNTVMPERVKKREPTYRVDYNTRIPVSKAHGSLWKSRLAQALHKRKSDNLDKAWRETLNYYRNDQIAHRYEQNEEGEVAGNEGEATKIGRRFSETENIVFANSAALVPMLYAKNPTCEFTANDPDDDVLVPMLEKLVSRLMSKRSHPGVNLKPKVHKAVVMTNLTNAAYIEVGYTFRKQSSDAVVEDIATLSKELMKAKTPQQLEEIEGKIASLEEQVDVLRPAGPFAKFRRPHDVVGDPHAMEDDHSDGNWLMICDFVSTAFINARYTNREGTKRTSVYKPTHVLRANDMGGDGENSAEHEINNASLFATDEDAKARDFGYDDEKAYRRAQRTKVWWVWDKVTRRVSLYADDDWTWPIWVWDDPYNLQGFYPIFKVQFYTDPENTMAKGEVTYYLDQQDGVNEINSEMKQARQWARRNIFFDANKITRDDVEKYLKGDEDVAIGVDVPEGMKIQDSIYSMLPPSMQFMQLFDKEPLLAAIDRISSVQPVMRGAEFKTNTTNQAINQYNSVQQTRTDARIDAIEDLIGQVGWALTQLCLQFMTQAEVAMLIGAKDAAMWRTMGPTEIAEQIQMTVVGGSTQKPTSEAKKQQALDMGQVLGQFVNAAPGHVLMVMLEAMRKAFNDVIPDEQWKYALDGVKEMTQTAPPPGAGSASNDEGGDMNAAVQQVTQLIDQLPPEAKQALGTAMARGVPAMEAFTRIMEMVQGGAEDAGNGQTQPQPQQAA